MQDKASHQLYGSRAGDLLYLDMPVSGAVNSFGQQLVQSFIINGGCLRSRSRIRNFHCHLVVHFQHTRQGISIIDGVSSSDLFHLHVFYFLDCFFYDNNLLSVSLK